MCDAGAYICEVHVKGAFRKNLSSHFIFASHCNLRCFVTTGGAGSTASALWICSRILRRSDEQSERSVCWAQLLAEALELVRRPLQGLRRAIAAVLGLSPSNRFVWTVHCKTCVHFATNFLSTGRRAMSLTLRGSFIAHVLATSPPVLSSLLLSVAIGESWSVLEVAPNARRCHRLTSGPAAVPLGELVVAQKKGSVAFTRALSFIKMGAMHRRERNGKLGVGRAD